MKYKIEIINHGMNNLVEAKKYESKDKNISKIATDILQSLCLFLSLEDKKLDKIDNEFKSPSIEETFPFKRYLQQELNSSAGMFTTMLGFELTDEEENEYKYSLIVRYLYSLLESDPILYKSEPSIISEVLFYRAKEDYNKSYELIMTTLHDKIEVFSTYFPLVGYDFKEHQFTKPLQLLKQSSLVFATDFQPIAKKFCLELRKLKE